MRFLTEEDFARFAAEREQIATQVEEKIAAMELDKLGIHELLMLRNGFQAQADACEKHIANGVAHLRAMDASWAEIGKALGVSKQAAQQKFGS